MLERTPQDVRFMWREAGRIYTLGYRRARRTGHFTWSHQIGHQAGGAPTVAPDVATFTLAHDLTPTIRPHQLSACPAAVLPKMVGRLVQLLRG